MASIPSEFRNSNYEMVPYDGSPVHWRISAYGICIIDDQLLLVHHKDEKFYDIPGGGVELEENLDQAFTREGLEEAGWELKMDQFIYAQSDWFYHTEEKTFYKTMGLYFTATGKKTLDKPTDPRMIFSELVPLSDLEKYDLYPNVIKALKMIGR